MGSVVFICGNGITSAVKFEVEKDSESLSQKIDITRAELNRKIDHVEERLNQKIDYVEERLNQKMQSLEYKLTVKIGAMITIAVAAITWLNKILV